MTKPWMSQHKSSCSSNKRHPMKTSASATLAGEHLCSNKQSGPYPVPQSQSHKKDMGGYPYRDIGYPARETVSQISSKVYTDWVCSLFQKGENGDIWMCIWKAKHQSELK